MSTSNPQPGAPSATHFSLPRDIAIVVAMTLGAALVAAHFELNEVVFSFTRHWEHLQLDEWPIALLVLALSLMWLTWRRYQQALVALKARQVAESNLAIALRENRELGHQHLRGLEAERKHLARELHDELGQYLNAIKLDAVALSESDDAHAPAAKRILQAVDHVHGVVSDMIRRLRPVGLDELGLVAALEGCLDQWRQRLPAARFTLAVRGDFDGLDELTNLTVYRLVQEALTNSYKHARAERIDVSLQRQAASGTVDGAGGRALLLTVSDDGCGMDPRERKAGFGLGSMRERVEMMGGELAIRSSPGHGLSLEARIPS